MTVISPIGPLRRGYICVVLSIQPHSEGEVNGREYNKTQVCFGVDTEFYFPTLCWSLLPFVPGFCNAHWLLLVVVDWGFTMLLTSQVISFAFYSERERSDKFCSEALISAWGSFTCHKSMTWDPQLYFPSEGSHTQNFYALKKSSNPGRVWTREPQIQWRVW